jgi:tRNA threonylcarbamoyladenosine biosynthesis protein TsaB
MPPAAGRCPKLDRMPRLLAFDTSTETLSIALCLAERMLTDEAEGGALASATLIPRTVALLARAGITLQQLDAIGFGRGPGAFTGLRTAASVAQGFALGAGKPVLPIDSLMLVAEDARAQDGEAATDCWVAMDARMDEIYAGRYRHAGGQWHTEIAPCLLGVDALNAHWLAAPPSVVAGNALAAFGGRLQPGAAAVCIDRRGSRAAALGRLAEAAWAAGAGVDAALALPVYVRDRVALTTAEREAARASPATAP